MPRTNINAVTTSRNAVTAPSPTAGDATNFNTTANDGHTILVCKNTDATPRTVTVHITRTVDGVLPAAKIFTIAAGTTQYIGPFATQDYGTALMYDVSNALVTVLPLRHGA